MSENMQNGEDDQKNDELFYTALLRDFLYVAGRLALEKCFQEREWICERELCIA